MSLPLKAWAMAVVIACPIGILGACEVSDALCVPMSKVAVDEWAPRLLSLLIAYGLARNAAGCTEAGRDRQCVGLPQAGPADALLT